MIVEKVNSRVLFDKISEHLIKDEKPSDFMNYLSEQGELDDYPFVMLNRLQKTEQTKKHHPEGSVWNHTMLVIDEAAKVRAQSKNPRIFMWAALLHDIGKPETTRVKGDRITSYDHDKAGEKISIEFLRAFQQEEEFIHKVSSLVRYHMHMLYVLKNLPYKDLQGLYQNVDIKEIALLCRCDRLGRGGVDIDLENNEHKKFLSDLKRMVGKYEKTQK